jgi:5,10-methylenetetrahydromethanopterin reductase
MTDVSPTADPLRISCALPPSKDFPDLARCAEQLGYERFWAYDSPALYGDIWVALARAADATTRIGLGTAVAVPSLRHPVVTASAIASVEELAPGRLKVGFGTGFTARRAMGRPGMRWADLRTYVLQVQALLHGDVVEVDGAACQLIYSPGFGPTRPIDVPLLVAPLGPKGFAVSGEIGDGVILTGDLPSEHPERWLTRALLAAGTVLSAGEDHTSQRVREALGPMATTAYHALWEWGRDSLDQMPAGDEWLARVEAERPPHEQHLAVHEGHLVAVNERDRPLLDAYGPKLLTIGWTGAPSDIRARAELAAAAGFTEVIYQPAGPDIRHELESFLAAARG